MKVHHFLLLGVGAYLEFWPFLCTQELLCVRLSASKGSLCLYTGEICKTPSKDNPESLNSKLYSILKMLVWVSEHSLIHFALTNL